MTEETLCNGDDDDCNAYTVDAPDADADGWTVCGTPYDCNDADPAVHPEADDRPGDGVDADCDGVDPEPPPPSTTEPPPGTTTAPTVGGTDGRPVGESASPPTVDPGCGCSDPPEGLGPLWGAALVAVGVGRSRGSPARRRITGR